MSRTGPSNDVHVPLLKHRPISTELLKFALISFVLILCSSLLKYDVVERTRSFGRRSFNEAKRGSEKRCRLGPYVCVTGVHKEGIGATWGWYRRPILIAGALNAKVVVTMANLHTRKYGEGDVGKLLGVDVSEDCSARDLEIARLDGRRKSDMNYIAYSKLETLRNMSWTELCLAQHSRDQELARTYNITRKSVIVIDESELGHSRPEACMMSCINNEALRKRYQKLRDKRIRRPVNEAWIAVHFRWGDVGRKRNHTISRDGSSSTIDYRTGVPLIEFLQLADRIANHREAQQMCRMTGKKYVIHLMSEGEEQEFSVVRNFSKVRLHLNSSNWVEAMDILSLSDVNIGGRSSFFELGALRCDSCEVIQLPERKWQMLPQRFEEVCPHPSA